MSCTNPNLIKHFLDSSTGAIHHIFLGNGKYLDPHDFGSYEDLKSRGWYITPVPCGKCLSCRASRGREWAVRMMLELEDNPNAIFVTLTYNDAHLPLTQSGVPTLNHCDVQLFLKRLRRRFDKRTIRFYIAGEYGSNTHRPHYHGIIYGLSLSDFDDLVFRGKNGIKQDFYTSPLFERIWSNGFVLMSDVSFHTCSYVARYCLKKQFGNGDEYSDGRSPEYNVSSRKPGIGMLSGFRHLQSDSDVFSINGRDGVYNVSVPPSVVKRAKELSFVDNLPEICYSKSKLMHDMTLSRLDATGHSWFELLSDDDESLRKKLNLLPERR